MAKVQIIIGTVMGTALEVAEAAAQQLTEAGHSVRLFSQFSKENLSDYEEILLVCTSNTGMGDLPENIVPFYLHLVQDFPQIAGRKFGLINLGDSSYPNFAQAGNTLKKALIDIGAQQVGAELVMDAILVDDYAEEAKEWAKIWANEI